MAVDGDTVVDIDADDIASDADSPTDAGEGDSDVAPDGDADRIVLGEPCQREGYEGWRCLEETYLREDATLLRYEVRWNIPEVEPNATALWLLGNTGKGEFRTEHNALAIQDSAAASPYRIRSVEIEFLDPEGYWIQPAPGIVAVAQMFTELVESLRERDIVAGRWGVFIGSSGSAAIGAAALDHHGLGDFVKRYIFLAGPFNSDLERECTAPNYWAYLGDNPGMRLLVDTWNGWTDERFCQLQSSDAPYAERSVLGSGPWDYPGISIHVIIGTDDALVPWIRASNETYYHSVQPEHKTRHVIGGLTHLVLGSPEVAVDDEISYAIELVTRYVLLPPETATEPMPAIIRSSIPGGPNEDTFTMDQMIYARVENVGPTSFACTSRDSDGNDCADESGWVNMPNFQWTYDEETGTVRAAYTPRETSYFPGAYSSWWRDATTHAQSDIFTIIVL